ncbi:shikimate dehydrogenase [Phytohalomonas tamaricis]|uniref:shikimate dehydrogenase n=1 Tax=Phytohalomonas tamaricis TaxID=2081032 RepID=UPI000D0B183A|nr:shikimate dehydrogenase [Phytohalomonas tamaricis]
MSDLYCVFGNPIKHSRSPFIHTLFAEQTGEVLRYEARLAPLDDFQGVWDDFVAEGGLGANVTVPFKLDALQLADVLSARAQRAQAVNTLTCGKNGKVYADTTDGVGLVRDLTSLNAPLVGARILVLGAGGAVRGVLEPLLAMGPEAIFVANRTASKARELAANFEDLGKVSGGGFEASDVQAGGFDLVINGTSASLAGELPPLPDTLFSAHGFAYDMMYGAEPTVFMRWAEPRAAATADGLGMLVEQAAESFFLWRNIRPDTASVREALRHSLLEKK